VSRATIRRALIDLAQNGLIITKQGVGSVVASRPVTTHLTGVEGFSAAMRRLGQSPQTRVLQLEATIGPPNVTTTLGADVWRLDRLRLINGAPALVEWAYLPRPAFPGLDECPLEGSLYDLMDVRYQRRPTVGNEQISATHATRDLARLLDLPIAAALLTSIRTSCTATGEPVEVTYRFVNPERCAYVVPLGDAHLETTLSS
jgi:GntR family transcriptional regulator